MNVVTNMSTKLLAASLAIAGLVLGLGRAEAASGPWAPGEAAQARLLSSVEAAGDRPVLPVGLQVKLQPGWKTYWRSPGDAGRAPTVDWSRSTNVASVTWHWPVPHRFDLFGIGTFGYKDEVVFPLDVTVQNPGRPVSLRGDAEFLVCSNICVPTTFTLSLDLPAGPAAVDAGASNVIARFAALVPVKGTGSGVRVERVGLEEDRGAVIVEASSLEPFRSPDVFIEAADWSFGPPEFSFGAGRSRFLARLPILSGPDPVKLPGTPVTITVGDQGRAAEAELAVSATAPPMAGRLADLWPVLGLALLGGMLLNLMPCVLPVLSLKLLAVVQQRDKDRRDVQLGFLATAAGVVVSMLALAGVLIGVKSAGATIGWGVQFQNPIFLVVMAAVLTAFAVNLAGGFEIRMPSFVPTGAPGGRGLSGHFGTGALATLLATPCSAPFLGTAVGFALARDALEILAVFTALGAGLALPYLTVAAIPSAVRVLPRPGRWMVTLRRLLAVALAATVVWLLSVLTIQSSATAAVVTGASLLVLGGALALGSRAPQLGRLVGLPVALVAATAAVASPAILGGAAAPGSEVQSTTIWRPFDEVAIPGLVAEGKVVFVDATADWCITCQVNKKRVLEQGKAAAILASPTVVAMRADWTKPDAAIAAYLGSHDRYGIPFNIVYGPGAPRGILLPEILSEAGVLDAFQRAADRPQQ